MKQKTPSESPNARFDGAGGAFEEREGKQWRLRLGEFDEEVTLGTSVNDY